jgi:predicted nucleic acid-binding protein
MKDKVFLDTNIIVYAHDHSSSEKNVIAKEIMDYLWESKKGVISVQVLQEFFVFVTKKIIKPLQIKKRKVHPPEQVLVKN